uniref:DUF523 domain-containing protein n=1 Tax=Halomonas sp. TaxID=1486246 RepID=UPI0026188B97|nr:DUF523 domain-containing protein [Halomonas sp.]
MSVTGDLMFGAHGARILVSACLLGDPVRYDAGHKRLLDERLVRWRKEGRLVPVCPEVAAGLPTPRPAAEILCGSGADVLAGRAHLVTQDGDDPTDAFRKGAQLALAIAQRHHCRLALLTEGSPSCGSSTIYDGSLQGVKRPGEGVTTALLRAHGITVYSPGQLDELTQHLERL